MKIGEFLQKNCLTHTFFVKELEVTRQMVSRWVTGKTMPRKETILKIEKLTGGKVKPKDWFTE